MNLPSKTQPLAILGAGPAGSAAALAALQAGSGVQLADRAAFPRHKVCGEFLSPEAVEVLDRLGVAGEFFGAGPAGVRFAELHLGKRSRRFRLPATAWGLSRYRFDDLLRSAALARGAVALDGLAHPLILATGRSARSAQPKGRRLFGFKAHFAGPAGDAVELYFFRGAYVGIGPIENGLTNVCGLGPEHVLGEFGFAYDAFLASHEPVRERLAPLTRQWPWLSTGPLEYGQNWDTGEGVYRTGDALSFVDPFTGSGLAGALRSGSLAGRAAAQGDAAAVYLAQCRASLGRPFSLASVLRGVFDTSWAERLLPVAPARLLFRLTRP